MPKTKNILSAATLWLWVGFFVRGMLIGIADLFPGVSGGTMALLTGVYLRFIEALAGLGPALLLLLKGRLLASIQRLDWLFFTALIGGAGLSIILFAKLASWLLEHQEVPTLSLFAGLVLYTGYSLICSLPRQPRYLVVGITGLLFALFLREILVFFIPEQQAIPLPLFAIGGAIAIGAMMLPGISGSLLLLLLGMYRPVIDAIAYLNLPVLAVFACGVLAGLLVFAPLLRYSYYNYRHHTLAFLAGLTFGAVRETLPFEPQASTILWLQVLVFVGVGLVIGRGMDYVAKKYS